MKRTMPQDMEFEPSASSGANKLQYYACYEEPKLANSCERSNDANFLSDENNRNVHPLRMKRAHEKYERAKELRRSIPDMRMHELAQKSAQCCAIASKLVVDFARRNEEQADSYKEVADRLSALEELCTNRKSKFEAMMVAINTRIAEIVDKIEYLPLLINVASKKVRDLYSTRHR